ncbi:hypothetical protein FG475_15435 [Vibrio navarrensis]|nr:hypothetical protein [Vibrio navarrensis]
MKKVTIISSMLLASGSAFATVEEKVTSAIASGESLVQLTTGGVITVAAICFGVGLVASLLTRR